MNQCRKCLFFDEAFDGMHQSDTIVVGESEEVHYCTAFPDGIPPVIWQDIVSHKKPYEGDNGIQFVKR